jgi:hypothetical protein
LTLPTALFLGWAGVAAWMDLSRRRVRWWWSLLGLLGAGAYRLAAWAKGGVVPEEALIVLVAVATSYALWKASWWGGADAKTAMTLVIAIPDLIFIAVVASGAYWPLPFDGAAGQEAWRRWLSMLSGREKTSVRERFPLVAVMVGALPIYLFLGSWFHE